MDDLGKVLRCLRSRGVGPGKDHDTSSVLLVVSSDNSNNASTNSSYIHCKSNIYSDGNSTRSSY